MNLPAINFTRDALSSFDDAIEKEWLVTNGLGGYAASTVLGVNTRKYHGLLVAALHPPGDRTVCLEKLDEDVCVGSSIYRLGANEFQDKMYPDGYRLLKELKISPFPSYTYSVPGIEVKKTIFMPKGKNAVAVTYNVLNRGGAEAIIRVYPLLTCRHFHSVVERRRKPLNLRQQQNDGEVEVDFGRCEMRRAGKPLDITTTEFKLLTAFIRHRGKVIRRDQLLDEVWGRDVYLTDRVVDNHIANLRKKIEPDPAHPRFLMSVRGVGYRFDG